MSHDSSQVVPRPVAAPASFERRLKWAWDERRDLVELRDHCDGDEQRATVNARIHELTAKARFRIMESAGVQLPARDLESIAWNRGVTDTEALKFTRKWLQQKGADWRPWLWLLSPPGYGKSFAAAWAITRVGDGLVTRAAALVALMCPSYSDESYGRVQTGYGVAALEDLGTETPERRFTPSLHEFFEDRLDQRTIVTSNLSRKDLADRLDPRLIDRVNDRAIVVELTGQSLRRQGGGL